MIRQLWAVVGFVSSPCSPNSRHRWLIMNTSSCTTTSGISTATINALTAMINDGWDKNSLFIDIRLEGTGYAGTYDGFTCDASNNYTIGMTLSVNNSGLVTCYKHMHPDEGNVYDFTYWTRPDTHPGNAAAVTAGYLPPITKWADYNDTFTIPFPSWHTMDRWRDNKDKFVYIGRASDSVNFMDLPPMLRTQAVANFLSPSVNITQAVVVCGSHGEVPNNSFMTNVSALLTVSSIDFLLGYCS
jgi:hypothetical protein